MSRNKMQNNKTKRDFMSVLLFPPLLIGLSIILSRFTVYQKTYEMIPYVLHFIFTAVFFVLTGVLMARMVNLSATSFQSYGILAVVMAEILILLSLLIKNSIRVILLEGNTMRIICLLLGVYLFITLKICYLKWQHRNK